ncbi:hypothetical protein BGZ76_007622 [Entomortierella beljakovae]|nr:hypothetical protein BGZ76_007622 [Entomortierella beljakovae]
MNFSPTSRVLFLVQLGSFFSGLIVVVCCCLYVSAYPKSPEAGSVSAIACATLAFALISTLVTLVLAIRQKSGRTIKASIEGCWVGLAAAIWILASIGGIAKPANDMKNVSCKVLPSGKDTDDKNYIRACQSMFASTAFCILSALFFIATAGLLIVFSIQRAVRDKKAAKVQVGGSYQLGPSPSQYHEAEQAHESPIEESKDVEAPSPSANLSTTTTAPGTSVLAPTSATAGGTFSENVYQDPIITTPASVATPPAVAAISHSPGTSPYNTFPNGGHMPQASYQSTTMGYNYNTTLGSNNGGYSGQHVPFGSTDSNVSTSGYNQYHPNPYANSGNMYPPQPQNQGVYPMMGTPHQQSPYGTHYMNQQQQGQHTPVMEMPRPEHY